MSSRARGPRLVVGTLDPQDNRTRYKVYVNDNAERGRAAEFFAKLYAILGYTRSYTRAQIQDAVLLAGGGAYRVYYNSIVRTTGDERRRLFE